MVRLTGAFKFFGSWPRWSVWLLGVVMGVGLTLGTTQWVPYVNWQPIIAPLGPDRVVIRHDAKGDGRFGAPRSGNRVHRGVDLEAPVGTPVRAIRSGIVEEVGMHRGLGRYLMVKHHGSLTSLYAHLDTAVVEVGARVRQGQMIGTVGKTGNARSHRITPHLHLEVMRDGVPIDPESMGLALIQPAVAPTNAQAEGGE